MRNFKSMKIRSGWVLLLPICFSLLVMTLAESSSTEPRQYFYVVSSSSVPGIGYVDLIGGYGANDAPSQLIEMRPQEGEIKGLFADFFQGMAFGGLESGVLAAYVTDPNQPGPFDELTREYHSSGSYLVWSGLIERKFLIEQGQLYDDNPVVIKLVSFQAINPDPELTSGPLAEAQEMLGVSVTLVPMFLHLDKPGLLTYSP